MSRTRKGYSLFEVLIVLSIIALVALAAPAAFSPSRATLEAKAQSRSIAMALRATRSSAIAKNHESAMLIDAAAGKYRQEGVGAWKDLPKGVKINAWSLENPADLLTAIRYYPDGSSSGGEIRIASPRRAWRIRAGMNGGIFIEDE